MAVVSAGSVLSPWSIKSLLESFAPIIYSVSVATIYIRKYNILEGECCYIEISLIFCGSWVLLNRDLRLIVFSSAFSY